MHDDDGTVTGRTCISQSKVQYRHHYSLVDLELIQLDSEIFYNYTWQLSVTAFVPSLAPISEGQL
jgi:hypothetical protein